MLTLKAITFFWKLVRDIDDIDQAGIGWMHLVNFAEIDLDIVERVHDSKVARRKLKPGAPNAVALLAITVKSSFARQDAQWNYPRFE